MILQSLKEIGSENLGVDGRTILKWILGKYGWRVAIGFIWLRVGTGSWLL
jgi:hypothetical protein